MTVAMIGRWVAAVAGALLVLTAWASVVVTLIVAWPVGNWLTRWVDRLVNGAFRLATSRDALEQGVMGCDALLTLELRDLVTGVPVTSGDPEAEDIWELVPMIKGGARTETP